MAIITPAIRNINRHAGLDKPAPDPDPGASSRINYGFRPRTGIRDRLEFTRQCLWRVYPNLIRGSKFYPPFFVEGLPACVFGWLISPWLGQHEYILLPE